MKKTQFSHVQILCILATIFFVCFNGSLTDSNSKDSSTSPSINFYGTLQDHQRSANVKNIVVGGKYKDIPVYQVPSKTNGKYIDIDPKQNKILLDLNEIKTFELKTPATPSQSLIDIGGRKYIIITVTSTNNTKKEYIVEQTRRIKCQESDKGPNETVYEDRDLSFAHIKLLTLKGYQDSKHPDGNLNTNNNEKNKFRENTANLLNKIEANVKNLPQNNPTLLEQMKSTILNLLKSLRDQLQKFLDMVK